MSRMKHCAVCCKVVAHDASGYPFRTHTASAKHQDCLRVYTGRERRDGESPEQYEDAARAAIDADAVKFNNDYERALRNHELSGAQMSLPRVNGEPQLQLYQPEISVVRGHSFRGQRPARNVWSVDLCLFGNAVLEFTIAEFQGRRAKSTANAYAEGLRRALNSPLPPRA